MSKYDRSSKSSGIKINERNLLKLPASEEVEVELPDRKVVFLKQGENLKWFDNIISADDFWKLFDLLNEVHEEAHAWYVKSKATGRAKPADFPNAKNTEMMKTAAWFLSGYFIGRGNGLDLKREGGYYFRKAEAWIYIMGKLMLYDLVENGERFVDDGYEYRWANWVMQVFRNDGVNVNLLRHRWSWHHSGEVDYESYMSLRPLVHRRKFPNQRRHLHWIFTHRDQGNRNPWHADFDKQWRRGWDELDEMIISE